MNVDKKNFDKEANSWDEIPGRVKMANDIANAIFNASILNTNMNVLDFGCGTGLLALQLNPSVHSITGVDSSAGMLEVLHKKIAGQNLANIRTQHLNVEEGDLLEGDYDLIVSSMTLHHIKDIKALLEQFYKVSAPNGVLCIADLDPDEGQFHGDNLGVFHFGFNRDMLRQAFGEAGFDVIEIQTAAEVKRAVPGGTRAFTIFLMIGRKRI